MTDAARPAASLILMRDRHDSRPEILIAQRSKAMRFAGGAYVFPGGAIDPEDWLLAAQHCTALDPDDGAARIAAARETLEETAIAVALVPPPSPSDTPYGALLGDDRYRFDPEAFTPFARWLPPVDIPRRFDTRFYLAAAPAGLADPQADGAETEAVFWASAAEILSRCERGDGHALFPTRRMLERLSRFPSVAEAISEASALPERIITPRIEVRDDGKWLCIPADSGYAVTSELLETVTRG